MRCTNGKLHVTRIFRVSLPRDCRIRHPVLPPIVSQPFLVYFPSGTFAKTAPKPPCYKCFFFANPSRSGVIAVTAQMPKRDSNILFAERVLGEGVCRDTWSRFVFCNK